MSRQAKLNWDVARNKWKIIYHGRKYRFDGGTGKSDREAKKRAEFEWKRIRAEIDQTSDLAKPHRAEYETLIATWTLVLQWSLEHGDQSHARKARDTIDRLRDRLSQNQPPPPGFHDRIESLYDLPPEIMEPMMATINELFGTPENSAPLSPAEQERWDWQDGSPTRIKREIWQDRIRAQETKHQDRSDSVESYVDAFLKTKRAKASIGKLSAGRCDALRVHLHHFRDWLGRPVSVKNINGRIVQDYYSELLNGIADGHLSPDYAKDLFGTMKSFVRWLWRTEAIETLPRDLESKELTISKKLKSPEVFTIEEIGTLLDAATDRTKLYILLMLNTGMTQKDICDLLQSEVDWKKGTITRKRSKTQDHENVPTVRYRLWKNTFRLLRQERAKEGPRALLNTDGGPLKVEVLGADRKLQKIDNVASAFNRLRKATKIQKPSKLFRKTSATLIGSNKQFAGVEVLFLGHAPASVSDRHYTQAPEKLLDEAVAWLGTQYGIVSA